MPQGTFTLSLAEHFEMTDDFMKATFRLREGIKFHNGEPVTTEDVKFTFENYKSLLNVMYADAPYTVISRGVPIHPTVSELIPTLLGDLQPMA